MVVPTELERRNAYIDIAVLVVAVLIGVNVMDTYGVPAGPIWAVWAVLGVMALTSEAAADVGFIGPLAGALRNRFGQRRAHACLLAYAHYFKVAIYPVWRAWCHSLLRSARARTIRWCRRTSDTLRCWRPPGCSWRPSMRSFSIRPRK